MSITIEFEFERSHSVAKNGNGDIQFPHRKNASRGGWSSDRIKVDPKFTNSKGEYKGFWVLGKITKRILGLDKD